MPNRSKQKGDRAERQIVELLRSFGLDAYRVPLSGAVEGFKDDIEIRLVDETLRLESKVRAAGFSRIYSWLAGSDCLIIKADRAPALAIVRVELLAKLIATRSAPERSPNEVASQETLAHEALIENDKVYLNKPRYSPLTVAVPKPD